MPFRTPTVGGCFEPDEVPSHGVREAGNNSGRGPEQAIGAFVGLRSLFVFCTIRTDKTHSFCGVGCVFCYGCPIICALGGQAGFYRVRDTT